MKVNEIITQKFIKALSENVVPWNRPWASVGFANAISKRCYTGVNVLILSLLGKDTFYLTYKQAKELGGMVKRGEKGTPICFYKMLDGVDDNGQKKTIPFLRYYTVFGVSQCEGLKWKAPEKETREFKPIEVCEKLVNAQNAEIEFGGDRACYIPSSHIVRIPKPENFKSEEYYYGTLFHELIHREAKEFGTVLDSTFGSDPYAKEELVAEIGAAFLINHCGIDVSGLWDNSKAYFQNWISKLNKDPQLIISAASKAQKRFDNIVGRTK